jgi:hypothetical protein
MANFPDSSLQVIFNPSIAATIQQNTLQRVFRDALYPNLLFRMEALRELWPIHLGGTQTFSRVGLMKVRTRPAQPGVDPVGKTYGVEQWSVTAQQWNDSIDTNMPTSYLQIASQFMRNIHQLGMQAGQSMNRVVRDYGYNAYVAGNSVNDASALINATSIHIVNLTGFTSNLFNGTQQPVSAANPIPFSIPSIGYTGVITAAAPDVAGDPIHAGTLTISPGLNLALPARQAVVTTKASQIVYSGGGIGVDSIDATDTFAVRDIRTAIAQLRAQNVPTHEDGMYHWHLDPQSEMQVFSDNEFQRLNQSLPDFVHYQRFALGIWGNSVFYRNNEAPTVFTCDPDPIDGNTHGFELVNGALIQLHRPICTGQGWIEEKYLDQAQFISQAGVMGKLGEFTVTNNGVQVVTEEIQLIMRAPMDKLQQNTSTTWNFAGGFGVPSDELGPGSAATFKRAVVVVHSN